MLMGIAVSRNGHIRCSPGSIAGMTSKHQLRVYLEGTMYRARSVIKI
jgi:hypothetical protein